MRELLARPASGGRGAQAALGAVLDEADEDALEAEGVADAVADAAQDVGGALERGELRRDGQEPLDGVLLAAALGGDLRLLERHGGVGGDRDEDVELVLGGPAPVAGLVDGDDPQELVGGRAQRQQQRILRVPAARDVLAVAGDVGRDAVAAPVVVAVRDEEGAAAVVARVEQRGPLRGRADRPEQELAGLVGPADQDDLEVVPGRAVEVDGDGPEAHRPRDRLRRGRQHAVDGARAQRADHAEQRADVRQAVDGRRRRHVRSIDATASHLEPPAAWLNQWRGRSPARGRRSTGARARRGRGSARPPRAV